MSRVKNLVVIQSFGSYRINEEKANISCPQDPLRGISYIITIIRLHTLIDRFTGDSAEIVRAHTDLVFSTNNQDDNTTI